VDARALDPYLRLRIGDTAVRMENVTKQELTLPRSLAFIATLSLFWPRVFVLPRIACETRTERLIGEAVRDVGALT
jgi:hypothetical protein